MSAILPEKRKRRLPDKYITWSRAGASKKSEYMPIIARDGDWSWNTSILLFKGQHMEEDVWPTNPPPLFTYEGEPRDIDQLVPLHYMFVISERLRRFLEVEAPGAAEYLPIRLKGPDSERLTQSYWAINFLRVFDCLHDSSYSVDEDGKPYVEVPIIDPSKFPADGVLGMIKDFELQVLMRTDLKRRIVKAGFRGLYFARVGHFGDGTYPPFF